MMSDNTPELAEALRQRQSAGGAPSGADSKEERDKRAQMEERRAALLTQCLSPDAKQRLSRISMVKPEKARAIEDLIIRMAQTGQIRAKLEESQLIELLGQLEPEAKPSKVVYHRRKADSEDEDEDYGF